MAAAILNLLFVCKRNKFFVDDSKVSLLLNNWLSQLVVLHVKLKNLSLSLLDLQLFLLFLIN